MTLEIGQKVKRANGEQPNSVGTICEIDTNRARVSWPYREWVHANRHSYGECSSECKFVNRERRTWLKPTALVVVK